MDQPKQVYFFGDGQADGGRGSEHLLGGKGASLAEMTKSGLRVPPGFTLAADNCRQYFEFGKQWPKGLREEIRTGIRRLEELVGRRFGRGADPLLVAVRSGAAVSMPGMMDTILNVGLNPDCVRANAEQTSNPRAAWEAYRHFLVTFGETIGGVDEAVFENILVGWLEELRLASEAELDAQQMEELCNRLVACYERRSGRPMPTDPFEMLFQAIEAVFASWNNDRAVSYRRHHRIEGLPGTAVNVQVMCPSEVSGVLFTAHPVNPDLRQMIIESSFGLGEAVVLGKVTPDQFVIDKETGEVLERHIADKRAVVRGLPENRAAEKEQGAASLNDERLRVLIELGNRVEDYYGHPCDIEWGLAGDEFYLLQARPIKYVNRVDKDELERLRQAEITRLRELAEPGGTVWSRYNLAEILAQPTPMSWEVVRQFMSVQGGFGRMYRDLGFDPDPALDEIGIFDLICGRPYCNLSREPRIQYRHLPFEHPFEQLKKNPQRALYPSASFNPGKGGWRFWLLVPFIFVKLFRSALKMRRISKQFADKFRTEIVPPFLAEIEDEEKTDLSSLDAGALLERWQRWLKRTLFDFGRHSLKPTALAGIAMSNLERALARLSSADAESIQLPGQEPRLPETLEKARSRLRKLVMNVPPDPESDLPGAIRSLGQGKLERAAFLKQFGHRGSDEMELSSPRWREQPATLDQLIPRRPLDRNAQDHDAGKKANDDNAESPFAGYKISALQRQALDREVAILHTYLRLRETAKHHLMRGYFVIRKILLELDKRYELAGGVFFLTPEELPDLLAGKDFATVIARRRRQRELLLQLHVPPVLFSDDLQAIGRPVEIDAQHSLQGVPLSAGMAEGKALVLAKPPETLPSEEAYILVCPTTDPAWMPLFIRARAVVMETGGMLSHGAIVAREFGLPAVAGLPDIRRRIQTGQRIQVDGSTGKVNLLD